MVDMKDQTARPDLRSELEDLAAPLARRLGLTLALYPVDGRSVAGQPVWLSGPPTDRDPDGVVEVTSRGVTSGQVALWSAEGEGAGGAVAEVSRLIGLIADRLRLETQERDLLDELSASWENLEAVYDISSDLHSLKGTPELLAMIIDRAVTADRDLKAVMWIESDGRLVPAAARNASPPPELPLTGGLIGTAISSRTDMVLTDRHEIDRASEVEPEFARATSLAVAPVTTSVGLKGALSVWREDDQTPFDSRVIHLLKALALQAAMVIENDRLHQEALENELIRQEVEIGSDIQQSLLLGTPPGKLTNMRVAAVSLASRQVAGDFYDFFRHRGYLLDVIVGDVMGKGIAAALLGAATKSQFLRSLTHLTAFAGRIRLPDPAAVVSDLHAEVVPELITLDIFITLCYARIDLGRRVMEFVDCGHTEIIHYQKREGRCQRLKGDNLPLGFVAEETYRLVTLPLHEGDMMFFYSDGVTECRRPDGEMYGIERLVEMVEANADLNPQAVIDGVKSSLIEFSGHDTFEDDVTCVALKIVGADETEPPVDRIELDFVSELEEATAIRMFVRSFCVAQQGRGLSDSALARLLLAVHEAATNVVKHAYESRQGNVINVVVEEFQTQVNVNISHQGRDLDLSTVPPPEFDGTRDGGFGLYIIEESVDEVRYFDDNEGRHCVSLVMKKDK